MNKHKNIVDNVKLKKNVTVDDCPLLPPLRTALPFMTLHVVKKWYIPRSPFSLIAIWQKVYKITLFY